MNSTASSRSSTATQRLAFPHDGQVAQGDRDRELLTLRVQEAHELGKELACFCQRRRTPGLRPGLDDLAELAEEVIEERLAVGGGREQVEDHPRGQLALADPPGQGKGTVAGQAPCQLAPTPVASRPEASGASGETSCTPERSSGTSSTPESEWASAKR